jgi:iron complex outermembrane receptor protein
MKRSILLLLALICFSTAWSQNKFQAIIKDEENKQPLVGANVVLEGTTIGASADLNGFIEIHNIPDGKQKIIFSYIGYQEKSEIFNFPLLQSEP